MTDLSIKNYALIDDLNATFGQGFITITGETGAGKSILLGALSLVLGKRADLSALKDRTQKCIIEAEFSIGPYQMEPFFRDCDLDYETQTIIRREILPSGKSRAFVNDSPVTLDVLSQLGNRLVDIHSQHQTLQLTDNAFQFRILDALAGNGGLLRDYKNVLLRYNGLLKEQEALEAYKNNATKELDYNSFLLQELDRAPLQEGILEQLEAEYGQLSNVETLMELLAGGHQLLNAEQMGVLSSISELGQCIQKLAEFGEAYQALNERMQSLSIELNDLASELEHLSGSVEPNPARLEEVNGQLGLLHDLFKKHHVDNVEELIKKREELAEKVGISLNIDDAIQEIISKVSETRLELQNVAHDLGKRREAVIPGLTEDLNTRVSALGMPSASFKIDLAKTKEFKNNGTNDLSFLFSANRGSTHGELKKVASGGELSRIMLVIKSILAAYEKLPTLMFDEIDTGVSGEISNKMGEIMKKMGDSMQVFSITHLPQVASKGQHQFKVYKEEVRETTFTKMKPLSTEERIVELAEMLGGKSYSESAVSHAKQLLLPH